MPVTLLALASIPKPSVTLSSISLPAQHPLELMSEEEEEEVELVGWDHDDDFKAASPTASDTLGEATLVGLAAGCAAPTSGAPPAPRSSGSPARTPAETSIPPSLASVLAAPACGDAEASAHLKSILV
jgi:hypothetical protein